MQMRFPALLFISMSCSINAMDGVEVAPSSAMQKVPSWDDIYSALRARSVDDLGKLVDSGFSLEERDEYDNTLLHNTTQTGSTELLRRVMSQPDIDVPKIVNTKGHRKQTALHIAARLNQIDNIELLLKNGAHLLEREAFGKTPLHVAAWYGSEEAALVLLSHMSAPDQDQLINHVIDDYEQTPLALAHKQGHAMLVQLFTDYSLRQQKIEALLKEMGKE